MRRAVAGVALAAMGGWSLARALNRSTRAVTGTSMLPSLAPGDRLVVVRVAASRLRRGDVVVVRDPREHTRESVKRVVGLPGEQVALGTGGLRVDGVPLDEPYVSSSAAGELSPAAGEATWTVPADHLVVLGDHRAASTDSRAYGPVPARLVTGRVAFGLWPLGRAPHRPPTPRPPTPRPPTPRH